MSGLALVFGDTSAARDYAAAAATAAGWRVAAALDVADAAARLDDQIGVDLVLLEFDGAADHALIGRVAHDHAARKYRAAIRVQGEALDDLGWLIAKDGLSLLCEPDAADRAIALALFTELSGAHVGEESADSARLARLAEEVARIARALAGLSSDALRVRERARAYVPDPGDAPPVPAATVRAAIRARRLRDRFFDPALFAEPAWDMLLDLFAARIEGRSVSVSSLCIAAAVPPTTTLRWIRALCDAGLFLRQADPADARRVFIALSDDAARGMAGWFAALA